MKEKEYEHIGPGTYAATLDKPPQEKKSFANPLAAAFGTLEERSLDTRKPGTKNNPGPGEYIDLLKNSIKIDPQANFKSISTRPTNLASDPSFPSPTTYNSADYRAIGKQNL